MIPLFPTALCRKYRHPTNGSFLFFYIIISYSRFSLHCISFLPLLSALQHLPAASLCTALAFNLFTLLRQHRMIRLFFSFPYFASSIARPMSWRMYLFAKSTHSVASYAFARASFKSLPVAVMPSTRPPFVTIVPFSSNFDPA